MNKISVIIPVYNAERTLARCLDSVMASAKKYQESIVHPSTFNPQPCVEIICVNDGSTDSSLRILENYRARLQGVGENLSMTVLTQSNAGQGAARNAGLFAATGDAVVFVDSDDFILSYALERLVRAAEDSGVSVVSSMEFACDHIPSESNSEWYVKPAAWMAGKKVQYSVCGKLFRREVLKGLTFPHCVYEDYAFATEVFGTIDRFAVVNAPIYVYCSNGVATTTRSVLSEAKIAASFTVLRHVLDFFRWRGYSRFVRRQLSDGLSSTIGQVYKARNRDLDRAFFRELSAIEHSVSDGIVHLTIKAHLRLGMLRFRNRKKI